MNTYSSTDLHEPPFVVWETTIGVVGDILAEIFVEGGFNGSKAHPSGFDLAGTIELVVGAVSLAVTSFH